MSQKKRGAPPKFSSPKKMQRMVDAYFDSCKGRILETEDPETGTMQPVLDKYGQPVIVDAHPPTVTGLALYLGFSGRSGFLNYQGKEGFKDVYDRALSRVEQYTEERLFDRDGVQGAKFSLANNFKNWSEKQELNVGNQENETFKVDIKVID